MNLVDIVKFPPLAVNCFTGSLAQLSGRYGVRIDEAQLLEAGEGYLYRAGLDEWGMPEYTFGVEGVGLRACTVLGAKVTRVPIAADWIAQLATMLREHRGVVVWVNSAHLDYAPVYSSKPGYLHAVLVVGMNDAATHVRIFDSLIVDREPHGCEAWLPVDAFARALSDRVRTEIYDHMGSFITMEAPPSCVEFDAGACLLRQAERHMEIDTHHGALASYRSLCMTLFRGPQDVAAKAARRLFDHIAVLYVVPGLTLLSHSVRRARCDEDLDARILALIDHWRALSILALKFEATASPAILGRIEERFSMLETGTLGLWQSIRDALCNSPGRQRSLHELTRRRRSADTRPSNPDDFGLSVGKMMHVLALGRECDLQDYIAYCNERDIEVACFQPPPLLPGEKERWELLLLDALAGAVGPRRFDHVVSFNDGFQVQVDVLKKIFGLPFRDPDVIFTLTDKSAFKSVPATGDFISKYVRLPQTVGADEAWHQIEQSLRLPVVVKPSNGFYSAGVIRVDNRSELAKALTLTRRVCALMGKQRGASEILIEEYIDGEEFSVDGYVRHGEVIPLLLHHKYPRLEGPTFHENAQISKPFDPQKGEPFMVALRRIIAAVGLDQSPFHAEFRVTADQRVYILELAPRISGGGISSRYLMDICLGLDVHNVDLRLHQSGWSLDLCHRRIGLEYDFSVKKSGVLKAIEKTAAQCRDAGASTVIQHRRNGELVMAPPVNVETVLTAFFPCASKAEALRIFDYLETCEVETEEL